MEQWRRFPFFTAEVVYEPGKDKEPLEYLQKIEITCASSGRGLLVFGGAMAAAVRRQLTARGGRHRRLHQFH
jgi:hypothetical protein